MELVGGTVNLSRDHGRDGDGGMAGYVVDLSNRILNYYIIIISVELLVWPLNDSD